MISYEPFFKTLEKNKISTYKLINFYNISSGTIHRMKQGKPLTTTTIDDFCRILNCQVNDIIKYIQEEGG